MSDYKNKYGKNRRKNDGFKERATDASLITQEENSGIVIGRNAVRELLKSGRAIDKILVKKGEHEGSVTVLVAEAIARGIPIVEVEKAKLDSMSCFAPHQGIIAMAAEKE